MLIAVNTRLLLSGRLEGLGRFANENLIRITKAHPEHKFVFIFDRPFSDEFVYADNIIPVVAHPPSRHPLLWWAFFDYGVPRVLKKYKPDLFFSPDGWLSLNTSIPQLPVIHDLNFFHNPEWVSSWPRWYYNRFFPQFIDRAQRIATVSEFTKQDICNRSNVHQEEVDVVYNGCSSGFSPLGEDKISNIQSKLSKGDPYFLVLGLVHPRKNLARTIEAFSKFKKNSTQNHRLVIVGSVDYMSDDVKEAYQESEHSDKIHFTGRLPEDELHIAVGGAFAMVYVSLFEGFGIPILEAMHCDVPVITSNTSSMPEVGGDAVLYADPYSVNSIADCFKRITMDEDLRKKLIKNGREQRNRFSWDQTAKSLWSSIETVLKNNR